MDIRDEAKKELVTILILIDGFLQYNLFNDWFKEIDVTILILIDGFLQSKQFEEKVQDAVCHNPYFNRWFSAIFISPKNL